MSRKPESLLKERVKKRLDQIPNCWYIKTQEVGRRGVPDILGCVNGYFFAIELKMKYSTLDPLQQLNLSRISTARGLGVELTPSNIDDVISLLESLNKPIGEIDGPYIKPNSCR